MDTKGNHFQANYLKKSRTNPSGELKIYPDKIRCYRSMELELVLASFVKNVAAASDMPQKQLIIMATLHDFMLKMYYECVLDSYRVNKSTKTRSYSRNNK